MANSNAGLRAREDDTLEFSIARNLGVAFDLGVGDDTVLVRANGAIPQVRVTFTSAEVGNGSANDSDTLDNQDGDLAVRLQAENRDGELTRAVSRLDDEGITFESNGTFTFDVRDLVSGVERGALFDTVRLGTQDADRINESQSDQSYYINAGMGNDRVTGGLANDFLVGGAGNDRLFGQQGDDTFIGGAGNDRILGGGGDDAVILTVATDGSDSINLKSGMDTVRVAGSVDAAQIRLTFTSSEVGDGTAFDSDTMAGQDGGLGVRLQSEDGSDGLDGLISRTDDEGISFVSSVPGVTFDVRDLISGAERGDQFDVVTLGTGSIDRFNERGETEAYYINAGMGNDRVTGGLNADFLVGGVGNDRLNGGEGDDGLLGGAGNDVFIFNSDTGTDRIIDFVSGDDQIDLSDFDIVFADLQIVTAGPETMIGVDTDDNSTPDFQIRLVNAATPLEADFIL